MFLWADESQRFINEHDVKFQEIARSKGVSTVYLTQNIPNYLNILGKERTYSLLSTLNTKIFHANTDLETNEYAVKLLGEQNVSKASYSESESTDMFNGSGSRSIQYSEVKENVIEPHVFTELKTGGGEPPVVEGVFYKNGIFWGPNNDRYAILGIHQANAQIFVPEYGDNYARNYFYIILFIVFAVLAFFGVNFGTLIAGSIILIILRSIIRVLRQRGIIQVSF